MSKIGKSEKIKKILNLKKINTYFQKIKNILRKINFAEKRKKTNANCFSN